MTSGSIAVLRAKRRGPSGKHPVMAAALRDRIITGRFKPGDRLPSTVDLQAEFGTTKVTVLKAIGSLVDHGYLRTEERTGVFVTNHPPHVSQFAIAFPWAVNHAPSQFYRAIHAEAVKIQIPNQKLTVFHDIVEHQDGNEARRLHELVMQHRLAGLILAHDPGTLGPSPLVREPGIPRVAIAAALSGEAFTTVYPDLDEFWNRALERLAAHGRRRVAVIMMAVSQKIDDEIATVAQRCARYGLICRPEWVHAFSLENAVWAKTVTQMLFRVDPANRPDALLIVDDNLVEPATAGVAASGLSVPGDLNIVAMANFPYITPSVVAAERLGFDIPRLMAVCMERITQERRGEPTISHTAIPALFEEE